MYDLIGATAAIAPTAVNLGVLLTGLLLGIRHGIDWDHIAAITDITSTTAATGLAEAAHAGQHRGISGHSHGHGGEREIRAHDAGPGGATLAPALAARPVRPRRQWLSGQGDAIRLGTLYALGHGAVVIALGLAAIAFGALLPDWLDPIMARVVGFTLVALGVWVMYSVYRYARAGERFRLRSRWMLVFDGMRYGWRRLQARIHGHEHVEPLEMSSYGAKTSFGVGMIRHRRRDRDTGPADRRGRWRVERRTRCSDAVRLRGRTAALELRDRAAQLGQLRVQPGARAAVRRG